jgi:type II secretory pathway predicted ATPase ExeA
MVETHFGLHRRAFPATPDHSCYYPATGHERALARLLRGLADGEGAVLLTAEPGLGKTLLCHCLLERLGPDVRSAFLTSGHLGSRAGLLQALLYELMLPHEQPNEHSLRLALVDHLLRTYSAGQRTVLLVDEAHHLDADELEELRLLGNLEARSEKAVQVVLVGQPVVLDTLRRPELASLRQRLSVRPSLEPLDLQESADYLLHHLRAAGGQPEQIVSEEALELLARHSLGIPRLLNQSAHHALALAAECGAEGVDVEVALEALTLLGLISEGSPPQEEVDAAAVMLVQPDGAERTDAEAEGDETSEDPSCRLFRAPGRPA